jgi:hypothetical protein
MSRATLASPESGPTEPEQVPAHHFKALPERAHQNSYLHPQGTFLSKTNTWLLTPYERGTLLFRHGDMKYTSDSAATNAEATTRSVAFAVFYSDVQHEATSVISRCRVSLTYNLYFEIMPQLSILPYTGAYESKL